MLSEDYTQDQLLQALKTTDDHPYDVLSFYSDKLPSNLPSNVAQKLIESLIICVDKDTLPGLALLFKYIRSSPELLKTLTPV